jgi:hypothetical protein
MANPVTKVISANDVKNGNAIPYVTKGGIIETLSPRILDSSTGYDMDGRFDNPRFYRGDSNGLQSTTTYTIATGADDGRAADVQSSASTNSTYDARFSNSATTTLVGVQYDSDEVEYDYYASYFRFNNIVAAQGATVQSAYLKVNKRGGSFTSGVDNDFYVAAYDADNKAAPTNAAGLNHSNYTTAEVTWNSATDTGNGTLRSAANGTVLSSPDIKTVIQEILDRSGWSTGNSIVLAFYAKSRVQYKNTYVTVEHYDDSGDVPPQLEITI